jgi:Toprim-like/Protein of unknown function (DUF3991)
MPTTLGDIADQVRKIPMSDLLTARGFVASRQGGSTMWRGNANAINVTGDMWFDHKKGRGGVGTIDLVMYLDGQPFKDAVLSLWRDRHGPFDAPLAPRVSTATQLPQRRPLADLMAEYAKRDDSRWHNATAFLTKHRGLPAGTIGELYRQGRIFANDRGGVVFLHTDRVGQVAGATIKSTNPYSHFQQCVGNKTGAWFYVGTSSNEASTIVVTESPIDAISYHALHAKKGMCILSLAGQYISDELLQTCDKNIIIAIDNPAFEQSDRAAEITRGIIAATIETFPHALVHTPNTKDWNDDLRQPKRLVMK